MKRSVFLQIPFVASAWIANARNRPKDRVDKGFEVEAGKDRFQEELLIMLILFQPAGSMEDYFKQVGKLGSGIHDQAHSSIELMKAHGMEVVGPPLKY